MEGWRRRGQKRADLSSVTDVENNDDHQVTKITASDDISYVFISIWNSCIQVRVRCNQTRGRG